MASLGSHVFFTADQLGHILKSVRRERDLTQAAVASRMGLSQNRLSWLESHPEDISVKQLLAWSAVLGLELGLTERVPVPDASAEW